MSEKNLSDREFVEKYESIVSESMDDLGGFFYLYCFIFVGICTGGVYVANNCHIIGLREEYVRLILTVFIIFYLGFLISYQVICMNRSINRKSQETLGMTKEKAKRYYDTIKQNVICFRILPLVIHVCKLNPEAKESQTQMMKGWYGMNLSWIRYVNEEKYGDAESLCMEAYMNLLKKPLPYRKFFVEKLFKLAIVDDGIHNDEWTLLMDIMKQLKFNKNYFDFFIKRYGPLRMEYEEDEQESNTSTENIPVSQLKAYFAILGLEESASDVEIKRAYHKLALQHHPDLPKNADRKKECEELMKRFNEAKEKIRKSRIKK